MPERQLMAEVVRVEDLEDWAARTPSQQAARRRLCHVVRSWTPLLPLEQVGRTGLVATLDAGPRGQRRLLAASKAQLQRNGEELRQRTMEARELYEQLKPLLGPASQAYVEQVI